MADHRPYALAPHLPLTRGQVRLIEADLLQILSLEGVEVGNALIAQSAYLRLLARFLNQARAEARIEFDADPEANDPLLDHFRQQMRQPGHGGRPWSRLLQTAEKRAEARRLRRVVLASVLAALVQPDSRLGLMARYLLFILGRGRVEFGPPLGRIPFRRLAAVDLKVESAATQQRLRSHLTEAIAAEVLLVFEDLQFSHHLFLIGFGLTQWVAAAHAIRGGRKELADADWTPALDFTAKALGPRSDFPTRLEHDPTLRAVLDALTSRPLFAFAMVRP